MKYFFLAVIFLAKNAAAQEASHWSLGIGPNYGGIGVKYSQPINNYLDLYANLGQSAGFALLSYTSGIAFSAGVELPFTRNQHHTFNIGAAVLDGDDYHSDYSDDSQTDKNRLSGYAAGYNYYFAGLRKRGQSIGVGIIHVSDEDEILNSLAISWGYKF